MMVTIPTHFSIVSQLSALLHNSSRIEFRHTLVPVRSVVMGWNQRWLGSG